MVATSKGDGASLWGKLKSGIGWLSLDFAEKIKDYDKPHSYLYSITDSSGHLFYLKDLCSSLIRSSATGVNV